MKILILNRGSSTIKCSLFALDYFPDNYISPIWDAHIQWKNAFSDASLTIKHQGEERTQSLSCASAADALRKLVSALPQSQEIEIIGHRIVHGGKYFDQSVFIDPDVKAKIRLLADLAPLHNLDDLEGIAILEELFPHTPQVAVFDTAFHRTLPMAAAMYPGPYSWYEKDIRRYGFHGTSFQYCSKRVAQMLFHPLDALKMVICHLGSGASLCAVRGGKSMDTTMGFTPLEGLMMDTRSGSIDPGILLHLLKKGKDGDELEDELYHKSGLLGLSGFSSDMRDIVEKAAAHHPHAIAALEVYMHRLIACMGSMIASLSGIDAIVFTAGIGENASLIRKRACEAFAFLGLKLDEKKNGISHGEDCVLSAPDSSVKVLLVHTREAFEIARECWKMIAMGKQRAS
jgi:acetate kinase